MFGFIYKTTNLTNGKTYVGMCSHENPIKTEGKQYLGSGVIIKNAIKRHGRKSFTREILEVCDSEETLLEAERKWIEQLSPDYNIESGGRGGISERLKEYWAGMTPEERKNARKWAKHDMAGENNPMYGKSNNKGRKKSKSECEKISTAHKKNGKWVGKDNPSYGKSTSAMVKQVWDNRSDEERNEIASKVSDTRKKKGVASGKNNPMYGRSAITEKKLRWYTNGEENKYISEGTEPEGFWRGRSNLSGKIGKRTNVTK